MSEVKNDSIEFKPFATLGFVPIAIGTLRSLRLPAGRQG